MSKLKSTVLIFGILVMCVAAALITFLVLSFSGAIAGDPVEITFKVADAVKNYDGVPLIADGYAITDGELLEGHQAVAEYTGSQTEAGESESGMNVKILDGNGYDVTDEYAVKVLGGRLTVEKCEVYVRLNDTEVVYNGDSILFDDYTLTTGSLAEGHRLGAAKKTGVLSVDQVLTVNDVAPAVYDASGRNVSANYDLYFHMGEVKILPRPLTVRPVGAKKVYDGEALECRRCEIVSGSLVNGDRIDAEYFTASGEPARITNAGEINVFAHVKIYNKNGEDVTGNYALDAEDSATLTVTKKPVAVIMRSAYKVYDGIPLTLNDFAYGCSEGGLKIVESNLTGVVDAGNYVCSARFEIWGDTTDNTSNYEITVTAGNFVITPLEVSMVYGGSTEKTYDGDPFAVDCSQIELRGENAEKFEVVSVTYDKIYKAGTASLNMRYPRFVVKATGAEVGANSINVINVGNQSVTITQRLLTLKVISIQVNSEDGIADKLYEIEQSNDVLSAATPLCSGDSVVNNLCLISYSGSQIFVDLNPKRSICNAFGEDVTDCYRFTSDYAQGWITIV